MDSRRVVLALTIALGACLLVIGIFIGRETTRPEPIAQQPAAPQKPLPPIFEPPAQPIAAPPPAATEPSIDPLEKQRVAQYFREIDRLQNIDVDNPEASAQALVASATSGDTSGFDKLVQQAKDVERKVRAVTPPPPCAAYHKKLVALLTDSREMIQKVAQGFASGGLDGLPALMTHANAEKARQESLAREEKELKRRYGL